MLPQTSATPTFDTPELSLAAFLLTKGYRLLGYTVRKGRVFFHFAGDAALDAALFNTNATIPARDYTDNLARLRELVVRLRHEGA